MNAKSCGVGVIGYGPGSASQTFHVPLIGIEPAFRLVAVSTLMPDVVRPMLPESIAVVTEVDDILSNTEIGLVVVAVPNAWHFEYAKRALEAGKHVVVEKPLAITSAEVDELIALAHKQARLLSQFHNRRWDGGLLTVQKLLEDGTCGDISLYEANYDRWVPDVPDNWREHKQPGGGTLYDLGIHLVDQTFALFGRPQAVQATLRTQRAGAQADDYFHLQLDYGRMQVVLRASMLAAQPGPRYKLNGSRGAYVKYGIDPQAGFLNQGKLPSNPGWGEDKPADFGTLSNGEHVRAVPTVPGSYQSFYKGLSEALTRGMPQPVPAEDARDIIALLEACVASSETGRQLNADEIGFLIPPTAQVTREKS